MPSSCVYIPPKYMKRGRKGWTKIVYILPSMGVGKFTVHLFNGPVPKAYNTGWWKVIE